MDTVPSNGKQTTGTRTATILPINSESHRERTSTNPDDNDGANEVQYNASETTLRLVYSVEEAAFLLGISRGLAYELVARGELDSIRLGRRIVIPRVVLEKLTGTTIA